MANRPISMNKIKHILRLHFEGTGSKSTSAITGVSRNVVRQYITRFKTLELTFDELQQLNDNEVYRLFFPEVPHATLPDIDRYKRLQLLLPEVNKALKRKGVTIEMQWQWYIEREPDGYARTQFYQYLQQYRKRSGYTMHLEHKAGEKLFVDFAGEKLRVVDTTTGELKEVEVFVAILGCSQLTYVEACETQKKEDFITCCRHTLEYLGGSPRAIVPDNLKSAVTKSSKYEPILNESFATFAEHYNTTILPARAFKPKDKSLVEGAVKLVYQRIYARLGEKIYTSIKALNEAIWTLLEEHNNSSLKQGDSRRKIFEDEEKPTLLELPEIPYEIKKIKECTVMKNGHVGVHEDRHYYSVPYTLTGKKVRVIYDSDKVEIYYQFKKVAEHTRNYKRNHYTTKSEHLASQHQFLSEWSSEFFLSKGKEIAEEVYQFLEGLLDSKAHPEQGYKACQGVLNLGKRFGTGRLINACKRAIEYNAFTYYIVEDILKKGMDKLNTEEEQIPLKSITPTHKNVRGKDYYQHSLNLNTKQS